MTAINREQIFTLVELQKIETEKKTVQSVLDQVEKKVEQLDRELKSISDEMAADQAKLKEIRERYQELEEKVRTDDILIQKIEAKRRAVQTEREYQSLMKEEDQLKTLKSQLEDEMIACMDQIETIEKGLGQKESDYGEISGRVEDEKQTIRQEAQESEERHRLLSHKWDEVAARTQPALLKTFKQIKVHTPMGDAVVPVRNAVCYGCHMNIPPQMYNELQRFDSLKLCPFCNRILYWDNG
ncbi:MAG: zinc ribbon domain-containing protein [Desulfobacterales bacterium]